MFCKERMFLGSASARTAALLTLICLAGLLQAQTDPGPRPVGTRQPLAPNDPTAVCSFSGAKFPATPCIDFVQPPSVQPGLPADGAGQIISGPGNLAGVWFEALTVFSTQASVDGTDSNGNAGQFLRGLGPSFNAESCFHCHSQPAVGGSSPGCVNDPQVNGTFCTPLTADRTTGKVTSTFANGNPQVIDAGDRSSTNSLPDFIVDRENTGPILEARFPTAVGAGPSTLGNPASVPNGAVAELFVIAGRTDTARLFPNCGIVQENFQAQENNNNVVFRIPIPTFGDGLVENTPEIALAAAANAAKTEAGANFGSINFGAFNINGNDQTITRFGWKAQNKSLLLFAGEASNVEMGVTNEIFPTERTYGIVNPTDPPVCTDVHQANGLDQSQLPEDITVSPNSGTANPGLTSITVANIENDAVFMRLNGAPSICNFNSGLDSTGLAACKQVDASVQRGAALFGNNIFAPAGTAPRPGIGCVLCHWQTFTTGPSTAPGLNNATFHPFSDFALHRMGPLADGVKQGSAAGDQFRTAPLWGVGQRLFFLHDGREPKPPSQAPPGTLQNPLLAAIQDHCLPVPAGSTLSPSEACAVITNFNNLPPTCTNSTCTTNGVVGSQQDILNFLRSL